MTTYLDPSTDEVWNWIRAGKCCWCGERCDYDNCRVRHCDSCTQNWIGDPVGLDEGRPVTEECPDCLADKVSLDGVDLEVWSDLYKAGTEEDGQPYLAEVYSIVATFPDGSRLRFQTEYPGCEPEPLEEFTYFKDVRVEAKAKAESQLERIKKDGALYRSLWSEMYPMYGSQAYCEWEAGATPAELGYGGSR